MAKDQVSTLLEELQSNEAYIRSDAIKKIRKGKIAHSRIIAALDYIIEHDPSPSVREFAQSTLDGLGTQHSIIENENVSSPTTSSHKVAQPSKTERSRLISHPATQKKPSTSSSTIILEKTLLDNRVEITSENAIFGTSVGNQAYFIADLTSASLIQPPFSIMTVIIAPIMIIVGCGIIAMSLVFSINFDLAGFSTIGLILMGTTIYFIFPTYTVEIVTSSEKIKVFSSKNFDKCKTIVKTLNTAISRGELSSMSKQQNAISD